MMSFFQRGAGACASRVRVDSISPSPDALSARIVPNSIGTVEGWVITLARSRALDHLRAHKRRALAATASLSAHSPCQPSPATTLEDCVLQGERAPAVRAALAALPAEQRADIRSESFWPAVSGPTLLQAPLPSGKASIESAMVTKEFQLHHAYLAYAVRHYPRLAPPHLDLY